MSDAAVLERRRAALMTAARLQRRNMGIRWSTLRGKRAVHWIESGVTTTRSLLSAGGALIAASAGASGSGWLARALRVVTGTRGGVFGSALRALRRPSLWSFGMVIGRWLWGRRRRHKQRRALRTRVALRAL